jgi:anti-sigma B factor antagonist
MHDDGNDGTRLSRYCSMRHEQTQGTTTVRLAGEFDLSSETRFKEELGRVLDGDTRSFVIDLQDLEFIDSTGLRMLVQADAVARKDGVDFRVVCGNGQVREVLRVTGLDDLLRIEDSAEPPA